MKSDSLQEYSVTIKKPRMLQHGSPERTPQIALKNGIQTARAKGRRWNPLPALYNPQGQSNWHLIPEC